MNGTIKTVDRLVKKVRFPRNYVLRILRLGFLAPDLIEAILNGNLPLAVNLEALRIQYPRIGLSSASSSVCRSTNIF